MKQVVSFRPFLLIASQHLELKKNAAELRPSRAEGESSRVESSQSLFLSTPGLGPAWRERNLCFWPISSGAGVEEYYHPHSAGVATKKTPGVACLHLRHLALARKNARIPQLSPQPLSAIALNGRSPAFISFSWPYFTYVHRPPLPHTLASAGKERERRVQQARCLHCRHYTHSTGVGQSSRQPMTH